MDADPLRAAAERYADPDEVEALIAGTYARRDWRRRRGHKVCTACRTAKPVSAYGQDRTRRDGLRVVCLACRRVNA